MPDGFTRTNPSTFTQDEIQAAGYSGPYTEPSYNPSTEQLLWVNGAYVIEQLPPPPPPPIVPRWVDFSAVIMALPSVNLMLGAVLQNAPGLYGGLVVGLQNASEGDTRVFLNSWNAAYTMGLISPELITTVQQIAGEYDLPQSFIQALSPQT
jgi:hypothetical protein